MLTEHCVVRTYSHGYTITIGNLAEKLAQGWTVALATPMVKNGNTECIEYILQRPKVN